MKMTKMDILMLTEYFLPFDRGGSEWSVYYLAKSLIKKNLDISILTPNFGSRAREVLHGIKINRFPFYKKLSPVHESVAPIHFSNPLWFIWTTCYLFYFVLVRKPQVIHVQGKYFIPAAVVVGSITKIPVVTTLRDYIALCPIGLCLNKNQGYKACTLANLFSKDLPEYLLKYEPTVSFIRNAYILVSVFYGWFVSRFLKLALRKSTKIVPISQKVKQIYKINGIVCEEVIYNTAEFRNAHTKKENIIVYCGRLTPGKGFDLLLSAYKIMRKDLRFPTLVVVGVGLLRNISINKKLKYLGHITHESLLNLLAKSRFAIVPSVWEEPFGRVALESLAVGTPVLATNRGAMPEIIETEKTGVIIEPTISGIQKGITKMIKIEKRLHKIISENRKILLSKFEIIPPQEYKNLYEKII